METKQTAVEWLINVVQSCIAPNYIPKEIIEQALQMEREQTISNYCSGFKASAEGWNGEHGLKDMRNIAEEIKAEQYYNETYGGQDE
jgi:hypothetical protein